MRVGWALLGISLAQGTKPIEVFIDRVSSSAQPRSRRSPRRALSDTLAVDVDVNRSRLGRCHAQHHVSRLLHQHRIADPAPENAYLPPFTKTRAVWPRCYCLSRIVAPVKPSLGDTPRWLAARWFGRCRGLRGRRSRGRPAAAPPSWTPSQPVLQRRAGGWFPCCGALSATPRLRPPRRVFRRYG